MRTIWVIIPYYNCKKYVLDAVKSLAGQSYGEIVPVIINDGSDQENTEFLDTVKQCCPCAVILHKTNGGVSSARNSGIRYVLEQASADDRIGFLDADDAWEKIIDSGLINDPGMSECDIIGFMSAVCDSKLRRKAGLRELDVNIIHGGSGAVWSASAQHFGAMLYSVRLFKDYGLRFDEDTRYSEDKIFRMQALYLADNIRYINKVLYNYRMLRTSAVHSRARGIEYYYPILKAYMRCDLSMAQFANELRGNMTAGTLSAKVYFSEMLKEELQKTGSHISIDKLLQAQPELLALVEGKNKLQPGPSEAYLEYAADPQKYCTKMRRDGLKNLLRRFISGHV